MTTEKLSDLKRRIDEARAYEGTPVSVHHGNREYYDAIAVKHESAGILSRLIEKLRPQQPYGYCESYIRQELIDLITEDLT